MSNVKHVPAASELLTVSDAAQELSLSPARVRQLVDSGQIDAIRLSDGQRALFAASVEAERQRRESRDNQQKAVNGGAR